jgi:hypothetical protein
MLERNAILNALIGLGDLREFDRFQELAFHLAKVKWPGIRLTRKNHDLAADAIEHDGRLVLMSGWNGDLSKFKGDCKTLIAQRPLITKVVFATNRPLQEDAIAKWRSDIRTQFNLELVEVLHRDWLVGELMAPCNRWLAHSYLDVPIAEFADMANHLPRLRNAAQRILNSSISRQTAFELELDLRLRDKDSVLEEFHISDLVTAIRPGTKARISGQAGSGKTLALLHYAKACLSLNLRAIPLLISLRHWALQDCRLLEFVSKEPALLQQGINVTTLSYALEAGHVVLLLNGVNEIPYEKAELLRRELEVISGELGGATIITTCRRSVQESDYGKTENWAICPLNDEEIRLACSHLSKDKADRTAQAILDYSRLAELARIPLFLWEILKDTDSLHSSVITRFALLDKMVQRATNEHSDSIEIESSRIAPKFLLQQLAVSMCKAESTALSDDASRTVIADACRTLQEKLELSQTHNPRLLLSKMTSCHLLICDDDGFTYRFAHHVIQEYFAALHVAGLDAESLASSTYLSSWSWCEPIRLSIEYLCSKEHYQRAGRITSWFAEDNLASACYAIGPFPALWECVKSHIAPRIRELARTDDVNAKWIASRYAASTSQEEFSDIVFGGLLGYPEGTESPYVGLPIELIFRSLGANLEMRIQSQVDENFRLLALNNLSQVSSSSGSRLAAILAQTDPSPIVRRLAFKLLFETHKSRGFLKQFLREVKRQGGWDTALLKMGFACPEMPLDSWRRRQWSFISSLLNAKKRAPAFRRWFSLDPIGATARLRDQYLWLREMRLVMPDHPTDEEDSADDIVGSRLWCLRAIAEQDREWACGIALTEAQAPDFWRFGSIRGLVSPDSLGAIVLDRLSPTMIADPQPRNAVAILANQSPKEFAMWCIRRIVEIADEEESWEQHRQLSDAITHVPRAVQLEVASSLEFSSLTRNRCLRLLKAVSRARPEAHKQEAISSEQLQCWRNQLLTWAKNLPPLDRDSANERSDLCLALSECKNSDDVSFIINGLLGDFNQLHQHMTERKAAFQSFYDSGRTSPPPSSICPTSHSSFYHRALHSYSDERTASLVAALLNDHDNCSFAAHWMANFHAAPKSQNLENSGPRHRFNQIFLLRERHVQFCENVSDILISIRQRVEELASKEISSQHGDFASLLVAVARLEGNKASSWLVSMIETCSSESCWESVLHNAALLGLQLPGLRIHTILLRTVNAVRNPQYYDGRDESYRIELAAECLLFSDAPHLGVELMEQELATPSNRSPVCERDLANLIRLGRWTCQEAAKLDFTVFLNHSCEEIRSAAFDTCLDIATAASDTTRILELARSFVRSQEMGRSEADWTIPGKIAKALVNAPQSKETLLSESHSAITIHEAKRWLRLLSHLGGESVVAVAFDFAEKWGDHNVEVVCSLYPLHHGGGHSFSGFFANWRRNLCWSHSCLARLQKLLSSSDHQLGDSASRALHWMERERLGGGF